MSGTGMARRLRHLPAGLATSGALLVLGSVIGGLVSGGAAAGGAAAGVALVAVSYVASSLILAWADRVDPRLLMPVGLSTYVLKFALIGLLMAVVAATGWSGLPAMGVMIIATTLGWCVAQSVWTWRAKVPYVEVDTV